MIGTNEYGLWTLAGTIVGLASLAEAGLSISTTVFVSRDLSNNDEDALSQTLTFIFGAILILATCTSLIMWLGATQIVKMFTELTVEQRHTVSSAIQIGSLVVWAQLQQKVLNSLLQAFERYTIISIINTTQVMFVNLGLLVVVKLGGTTIEMMRWCAVVNIITLIALIGSNIFLLRGRRLRPSLTTNNAKMIGRYSFASWISMLGGNLYSYGDRLIIGSLMHAEALGIYGMITTIANQIPLLASLITQPLLPIISAIWMRKEQDKAILIKHLQQAVNINAVVALGMGAILFTFSLPIMQFILSKQLANEYYKIFQIAIVIYALYSLNSVGYYILFAIGAVMENLWINLLGAGLSLLLIFIGSYFWGLSGAVFGNIGYLLSLLFVVVGFKQMKLSALLWCQWVTFPFVWFLVAIIVSYLTEKTLINLFFFLIEALILSIWFFRNQSNILQILVIRKVVDAKI
jgi:O-antigen/teichoic acid export membrane protein